MNKNSIPNIWTAQEKVLHLYRLLSLALGVFALTLVAVLVTERFRNPLVIVRSQTAQEFYPTERLATPIGKTEVEDFAKQFLNRLYVWNDFSSEKVAREIAPFADEALVGKVLDAQTQKYVKELKGKHLSQAITFVEVDVQDAKVVCRFDRILKIEGIPLVIPSDVTLNLALGEATRLNPIGIYVTGILENDNAK